jgi:exodeoxyribonuclease VII small subunit
VNDQSGGGGGDDGPGGPSRSGGSGGPGASVGSGPTGPKTSRTKGERAAFDSRLCGVNGPLETLTFEELLAALELVATRLAGGELGIEAAVDLYEQAELLHEAAQERLAAVEARVERLGPPGQA